MSKIEWTDVTWNPAVGCEHISPGCDNCYAAGVASRQMQPAHEGLTIGRKWNGTVRTLPDRLDEPLRWKKPRRVFVGSMTDLFHRDVPDSFIEDVFGVMARCPQHTFQVLTKRPQRMAEFMSWPLRAGFAHWAPIQDGVPGVHRMTPDEWPGWPLPNVWLGTSIESDKYAWRANHLRNTPAAVRFLSLEPLLGPLPSLDLTGIDWVIVGGESGPGARPMHPDWVRDIRDSCAGLCRTCRGSGFVGAGSVCDCTGGYTYPSIPFFFKQRGSWTWTWSAGSNATAQRWEPDEYLHTDGRRAGEAGALADGGSWVGVWKVDKKTAGRDLDGRTWDEMPGGAA